MPFRLTKIQYVGGSTVDVHDADIIVLVGPNNSGKTRTLQEISSRLAQNPGQPPVPGALIFLQDVEIDPQLNTQELLEWFKTQRYTYIQQNSIDLVIRVTPGGDLAASQIPTLWTAPPGLGALQNQLVKGLFAGERLNYLGSPQRLSIGAHPDHPVQFLVQRQERLESFRKAFEAAFRQHVIVDAWGTTVQLRLSPDQTQTDFAATSQDGLPPDELVKRLASLPLIETQSDGVKSFAGILLSLLTVPYPLILLDEPEAFLHPPQARLLGRYLGTLRQSGQLIVATHSIDILLGLLASVDVRVKVVRLTRVHDQTSAQSLDPERVRGMWKDPLLRFSRAFDGLFHEAVVVCEGDTDSQFYSTVATWIAEHGTATPSARQPAPPVAEAVASLALTENPFDVMFTYAGSKQRIALVTESLSIVNVPVRIVTDFDVLNNRDTIRRLLESLGHQFDADLERLLTIVDAGIRGNSKKPIVGDVIKKISEVLGSDNERELTSPDSQHVKDIMESARGWARARTHGMAEVPSGNPTAAALELLTKLRDKGLHVVPDGAVESFVKQVGNKGPKWVVEVLDGGHIENARKAQTFVKEILDSVKSAGR